MKAKISFLLGIFLFGPAAWAAYPDGSFPTPVNPECWPQNALKALHPSRASSMKAQAAAVQSQVDKCEPNWFQLKQNSIISLAQFASIDYSAQQPYVKKISIPLEGNRRLRGVLAVKPGGKARDLVVVRCGIFCDSGSGASLSSTLMNVFEENPVNVLLLNSATGSEYAEDNGVAHIGGFDEGYQNLEAVRYVMKNQARFGLKVRGVHMMGISLGGLSSLFSSIYYDVAPEFRSLPMRSFLAVCPLVDTYAQFEEVLKGPTAAALIYRVQLRNFFKRSTPHLRPLQRIVKGTGMSRAERDEIDLALNLSAEYYEENWERLPFSRYLNRFGRVDGFELLRATSITQYRNRFSSPTLVLHASDDILVPWKTNSRKLLSLQDSHLGVVRVDRGSHCAFSSGLGWPLYSRFLSQAFDAVKDMPSRRLPVPAAVADFVAKPLWDTVLRSHYQWSIRPGAGAAELKVWHFVGHKNGCDRYRPTSGPSGEPYACQSQTTVRVPLSQLAALGFPAKAADAATANRMERYLNVHTRFFTAKGALAVGVKDAPVWLEADGKFHPSYGVF